MFDDLCQHLLFMTNETIIGLDKRSRNVKNFFAISNSCQQDQLVWWILYYYNYNKLNVKQRQLQYLMMLKGHFYLTDQLYITNRPSNRFVVMPNSLFLRLSIIIFQILNCITNRLKPSNASPLIVKAAFRAPNVTMQQQNC